MNGSDRSASVIDAGGSVVAAIPLGGKPEDAVSDPAAGRVRGDPLHAAG